MDDVLFLCTGNYYRSRFAEELFNHDAAAAGLHWRAGSRALALERGGGNVGPMSRFTVQRLQAMGIVPLGAQRMPQQCSEHDLRAARLIVALMESEHRPLMRARFSPWSEATTFWNVGDIDVVDPELALDGITREVRALLARLASASAAAEG